MEMDTSSLSEGWRSLGAEPPRACDAVRAGRKRSAEGSEIPTRGELLKQVAHNAIECERSVSDFSEDSAEHRPRFGPGAGVPPWKPRYYSDVLDSALSSQAVIFSDKSSLLRCAELASEFAKTSSLLPVIDARKYPTSESARFVATVSSICNRPRESELFYRESFSATIFDDSLGKLVCDALLPITNDQASAAIGDSLRAATEEARGLVDTDGTVAWDCWRDVPNEEATTDWTEVMVQILTAGGLTCTKVLQIFVDATKGLGDDSELRKIMEMMETRVIVPVRTRDSQFSAGQPPSEYTPNPDDISKLESFDALFQANNSFEKIWEPGGKAVSAAEKLKGMFAQKEGEDEDVFHNAYSEFPIDSEEPGNGMLGRAYAVTTSMLNYLLGSRAEARIGSHRDNTAPRFGGLADVSWADVLNIAHRFFYSHSNAKELTQMKIDASKEAAVATEKAYRRKALFNAALSGASFLIPSVTPFITNKVREGVGAFVLTFLQTQLPYFTLRPELSFVRNLSVIVGGEIILEHLPKWSGHSIIYARIYAPTDIDKVAMYNRADNWYEQKFLVSVVDWMSTMGETTISPYGLENNYMPRSENEWQRYWLFEMARVPTFRSDANVPDSPVRGLCKKLSELLCASFLRGRKHYISSLRSRLLSLKPATGLLTSDGTPEGNEKVRIFRKLVGVIMQEYIVTNPRSTSMPSRGERLTSLQREKAALVVAYKQLSGEHYSYPW